MSFSQIYTISSSQRNTASCFQINTLYIPPSYNHYMLCRVTHYILLSDKRPITSCQIRKLFPFLRYTNHILFTEMHIISSSRKTHYILFSEIHCILFSEIHIISSSQKCKLYPLHRNTHYKIGRASCRERV